MAEVKGCFGYDHAVMIVIILCIYIVPVTVCATASVSTYLHESGSIVYSYPVPSLQSYQ